MKISVLICATLLALTSACSHKSSNLKIRPRTQNKSTETTPSKTTKLDDLKYAGVIVLELGTTPDMHNEQKRQPKARIYICVDRTGESVQGKVDVDFASLGMPSFQTTHHDEHGKLNPVNLPLLTVSFNSSGTIQTQEPYSWGEVIFKSKTEDGIWYSAKTGEKLKYRLPQTTLFNIETTKGSLMSSHYSFYEIDGVTYYTSVDLWRMAKNKKGLFAMKDCEKSETPVFVKLGDELNK